MRFLKFKQHCDIITLQKMMAAEPVKIVVALKLLYEKFKNKGIEKEFTEKIITTQIGCGIYKQEKIVEYDQGAMQRNKERLEKLNTLGKEIDERQRILNELIGNGNTYDPGRA